MWGTLILSFHRTLWVCLVIINKKKKILRKTRTLHLLWGWQEKEEGLELLPILVLILGLEEAHPSWEV